MAKKKKEHYDSVQGWKDALKHLLPDALTGGRQRRDYEEMKAMQDKKAKIKRNR